MSTLVTIEQQIITSKKIKIVNDIVSVPKSDSYSIEFVTRILVKSNKNNYIQYYVVWNNSDKS
jgi:hypothetical protein